MADAQQDGHEVSKSPELPEHFMHEHALRHTRLSTHVNPPQATHESRRAPRSQGDESRVEGILIADDGEHPIICLDAAFSGVRVCARDGFVPELGDLVELRINRGSKAFRDDGMVVETSSGPEGTIIHLAM